MKCTKISRPANIGNNIHSCLLDLCSSTSCSLTSCSSTCTCTSWLPDSCHQWNSVYLEIRGLTCHSLVYTCSTSPSEHAGISFPYPNTYDDVTAYCETFLIFSINISIRVNQSRASPWCTCGATMWLPLSTTQLLCVLFNIFILVMDTPSTQ